MKISFITLLTIAFLVMIPSAFASEPAKMKMTTMIPAAITIPDRVESRIGTLEFEDGFPTEETAQNDLRPTGFPARCRERDDDHASGFPNGFP